VTVAAFGAVPQGKMVRRATAKVGDAVVVTGTIGDAALGVMLRRDQNLGEKWRLTDATRSHLIQRYLLPQPRNALAQAGLEHASAAMDVSDGLVGDLAKLCRASSVAAEIDVARVPLSAATRAALAADPALLTTVLTGGDDYEIVLTLAPAKLAPFRAAAERAGIAATEIGRVIGGQGARFVRDGKTLSFARPLYSHF
jgi:thiamine-monophosphate kinase